MHFSMGKKQVVLKILIIDAKSAIKKFLKKGREGGVALDCRKPKKQNLLLYTKY